jgi:hypothetical protein
MGEMDTLIEQVELKVICLVMIEIYLDKGST